MASRPTVGRDVAEAVALFNRLSPRFAAALIAAFFPGLEFMVSNWEQVEEYSYGYFIPAISAFLIWQRSDRLRQAELRGSWSGLALVLAGLALGVVGEASAIRIFGQNLEQLLLASPAGERVVIGLDPGFRTGVKVAVLSRTGAVVERRKLAQWFFRITAYSEELRAELEKLVGLPIAV